jgi:hypothetical protein
MARPAQKDLLSRLADAGEAAIQRLGEVPGGERFLETVNSMRNRLDELQRRVRGLEALEQRIADLERKVERLSKQRTSSTRTTTTKRK